MYARMVPLSTQNLLFQQFKLKPAGLHQSAAQNDSRWQVSVIQLQTIPALAR